MLQALPLVESGAADAYHLSEQQLALACASHQASRIHVDPVTQWLADLGLSDDDLRCGPQEPRDIDVRDTLIRATAPVCRVHNNCSGKHAGFLTLTQHLKAGPEYCALDHPVQQACKTAFEEVTGETSPTFGIDGCSAPNHASSLHGLARAMAYFASADDKTDLRAQAAVRLRNAMMTYPELVAGETRACTDLMRAMHHKVAIKTGAEGVFVAIVPERRMGIAVKIADGATRASEAVITALLVRLGVLDPEHPTAIARMRPDIRNWDGLVTGGLRPAKTLH
jgi:L-asparaginase II